MTDARLYLAIGVPMVINAVMFTLTVTLLRDLWRAELPNAAEHLIVSPDADSTRLIVP